MVGKVKWARKWWVKSNGRGEPTYFVTEFRSVDEERASVRVKPTYLVTEFRAVDEEWASVRGLRGEHGARDRPGSAASPRKYLKVAGCMWGGSAALPREYLKVVGCVLRMA